MTLQPSKARLALWLVCAAVSVWLAVELLERAPEKLAGQDRMNATADALDESRRRPSSAPPAVRFGLMPRAAHLVVLSGLEMGLYDFATKDVGPIEVRIYDRASGIAAALREGEVDVASVPLRVAADLSAKLGPESPVVVAGAALGDEHYVARDGLAPFPTLPFGPLRIGVLEAPTLDLARALELHGDPAPTVRLATEGSVARMLAAGELDVAVLPEPLATQAAALSGSEVHDGREAPSRRLLGGAVLVASRAFADGKRDLLQGIVTAHVLSARSVATDLATALDRATSALEGAGAEVPPDLFWARGVESIVFDEAIPRDALTELLELAEGPPIEQSVDGTVLDAARAVLEEEGDGG